MIRALGWGLRGGLESARALRKKIKFTQYLTELVKSSFAALALSSGIRHHHPSERGGTASENRQTKDHKW